MKADFEWQGMLIRCHKQKFSHRRKGASCYNVRFMTMTPEQRAIRARMAALARWSREDPKAHIAMMNKKFKDRFEKQVDPEGALPDEERRRRAESARKLFYQQLAYRSSRARSKA